MRKYEFTFILDSTLDDARVLETAERYSKFVRDHGGEVTRQENMGRRKFAYDINKKTEGSYIFLKMRAEAKTIQEINRALHFDETVLRSLIVLDDDAEARNAAAQRHAGSGDRPEGGPGDRRDDRRDDRPGDRYEGGSGPRSGAGV